MDSTGFLNGRVTLHAGDCLAVLPTLDENSFDSCVCDPPYHLASIVKRFGKPDSAEAQFGSDGAYRRASAGFMGKVWDGGDIAFRPETWAAVLRVLKPGAHLVAFAAPKNAHRMFCAIEDGGFEIRDTIAWLFGSGFPKSHDVSKAIDRMRDDKPDVHRICAFVAACRDAAAKTNREIDALFSFNGMAGHWTNSRGPQALVPRWDQWLKLKDFLRFGDEMDAEVWRLNGRKGTPGEAWLDREITGRATDGAGNNGNEVVPFMPPGSKEYDITAPATDSARQWQGWGTALKPAYEPICLARKPLSEPNIAANVLRWGTGAINVDGCRVGMSKDVPASPAKDRIGQVAKGNERGRTMETDGFNPNVGRWPANVVHDGSDEVVEAFPESDSSASMRGERFGSVYGGGKGPEGPNTLRGHNDSGSAARFFFSAKADSYDRIGSKHPTVKPLDLMQYLVRLVTPPKGTILDPFAGTGTTGEAAWREGFNAILIEREPEYLADIDRRMALCLAGPDERARESIKARLKGKPEDHGPLFDERQPSLLDEAAA